MGNQIKTVLLMAALTVVFIWLGGMLGGRQGMLLAFCLAAAMNFFGYWYSDRLVLRMYRAQEVNAAQAPELYAIVRGLTQRAGLPMPRVYVIPQEAPNAFATGRNPQHAAIAVTDGLLRLMNREEITGVLSHELAHVRNRDILIGSLAATMAGAIMMLASMARWAAVFGVGRSDDEEGGGGAGGILGLLLVSILAPLAALLIQTAISRSREYLADRTGAGFSGDPEGLARALEKLGAYSGQLPLRAEPATAHMFIVNPLAGRHLAGLFSTHPPLEDRIARLRGLKGPVPPPPASRPAGGGGLGRAEEARAMWERLKG